MTSKRRTASRAVASPPAINEKARAAASRTKVPSPTTHATIPEPVASEDAEAKVNEVCRSALQHARSIWEQLPRQLESHKLGTVDQRRRMHCAYTVLATLHAAICRHDDAAIDQLFTSARKVNRRIATDWREAWERWPNPVEDSAKVRRIAPEWTQAYALGIREGYFPGMFSDGNEIFAILPHDVVPNSPETNGQAFHVDSVVNGLARRLELGQATESVFFHLWKHMRSVLPHLFTEMDIDPSDPNPRDSNPFEPNAGDPNTVNMKHKRRVRKACAAMHLEAHGRDWRELAKRILVAVAKTMGLPKDRAEGLTKSLR